MMTVENISRWLMQITKLGKEISTRKLIANSWSVLHSLIIFHLTDFNSVQNHFTHITMHRAILDMNVFDRHHGSLMLLMWYIDKITNSTFFYNKMKFWLTRTAFTHSAPLNTDLFDILNLIENCADFIENLNCFCAHGDLYDPSSSLTLPSFHTLKRSSEQ